MQNISLTYPDVGEDEAKAVYDVVMSGWLHEGKNVRLFEQNFAKYCGADHAVAFFNGTVALHATLYAYGIGPGDEVIVPSFTFISTANCVRHAGAKAVFADIDPQTYCIDPNDIARQITPTTKAIIPVHYGGQPADMSAISDLAEDRDLILIEDAAEAHGALHHKKSVGTWGDAAMFSFTPTKNITTGEGAIVTTNDSVIEKKLRLIKDHGQIDKYLHVMLGYNYRMTEMQGAIGIVQLKKLDAILQRKQSIANRFNSGLKDIGVFTLPYVMKHNTHTYMLYTIRVNDGIDRNKVMKKLTSFGIQSKVYFPPVHTQPCYANIGYGRVSLPVTESVAREVFSIPCHSRLKGNEINYIIESLHRAAY